MAQCGPELQTWHEKYASRGLVVVGVSIQSSWEQARDYWEAAQGHTHPWIADQMFTTGQFFPGPMIGTPAYVMIDLSTMEIFAIQEGYSNQEELLFEPYLR